MKRYQEKTALERIIYYANLKTIAGYLFYKIIVRHVLYLFCKYGQYSKEEFSFSNNTYSYYIHKHNVTFYNERAVELPIIIELCKKHKSEDILEVGNVLSHYIQGTHKIIDKFEKGDNIENADACYYQPNKTYKLIVSISTLEHIGWDDEPIKPDLAIDAINNLIGLLSDDGTLVVTIPIGYNSFLDDKISKNTLGFDEQKFLIRRNRSNEWIETEMSVAIKNQYGIPYPSANALFIGIVNK
jgi:hypothetical protein